MARRCLCVLHVVAEGNKKMSPVEMPQEFPKTYNRRDSQMITHSSTSRPVQCLCMAERTGCPVLTDLWSYVMISDFSNIMMCTR